MQYRYKVVPFIGQTRGQLSASDVARQLESTINQHVSDGWEFWQLSDVNIEIQPGCISGLFGAKVQYVRFDQLIFRSRGDARVQVDQNDAEHGDTVGRDTQPASGGQRESRFDTSGAARAWQQKSDQELLNAAGMLHEYTEEGREIIRAELKRRSLK